MKIKNILILFTMLLFSFSFAEEVTDVPKEAEVPAGEEVVLLGKIKYNEATARIAAFKNLPQKIEKERFREYLKDPNKKENIKAIEDKNYYIDSRELTPFYYRNVLISYAVTYDDMPNMAFYYNIFGNLVKFDIYESNMDEEKTIGYSKYGNLINVAFSADADEQFVYNAKGKLIAHWVGDEMTNKKMGFKIVRKSRMSESSNQDTNKK